MPLIVCDIFVLPPSSAVCVPENSSVFTPSYAACTSRMTAAASSETFPARATAAVMQRQMLRREIQTRETEAAHITRGWYRTIGAIKKTQRTARCVCSRPLTFNPNHPNVSKKALFLVAPERRHGGRTITNYFRKVADGYSWTLSAGD